jgi:exodeoxyribonuclease VII small subunit
MSDKKVVQKVVSSLKYEEAAAELDQIIEQLEEGNLPLEDTLVLYERGQALSKHCAELLDQAELKIRTLAGDTPPGYQTQEE